MSTLDTNTPEYKRALRKHQKNRNPQVDQDQWSPFRRVEKRFKQRFPPTPDLSNVLDLAAPDSTISTEMALKHGSRKAYTVPRIPGLVVLPAYISERKQRELVRWSIRDQARAPNRTNLDVHFALPEGGLWNVNSDTLIEPLAPDENLQLPPSGPRQLISNISASIDNFASISVVPKPPPAPSPTTKPTPASTLIPKLRWANIGWYYHWGEKQYDFSKGKEPVHPILRELCKDAVDAVDWERVHGQTIDMDWGENGADWEDWHESYEPDAGIVNFYQEKDTLMAHVDRSEVCATSPLVSISLGNSAIFLIGGLTREVEPVPILLRSGDVVIMSGPACRRAYHGVPRILEGTLPPYLAEDDGEDSDWGRYAEFMKSTRVNINVRQVFPKGFEVPLLATT